MNRTSEIEHILICLKEHIALSDDEDNLLLDYITNLQQEKEDYKSRVEKAVDYINTNLTLVSILDGKEVLDKLKELKENKQ